MNTQIILSYINYGTKKVHRLIMIDGELTWQRYKLNNRTIKKLSQGR